MNTASKAPLEKGSEHASPHTAFSRPRSRASRSIGSVRSATTGREPGQCRLINREKSPVPHARSRTRASFCSAARSTPSFFQRPSIPYEKKRVKKSYRGATVENMARMSPRSCRSTGGFNSRIVAEEVNGRRGACEADVEYGDGADLPIGRRFANLPHIAANRKRRQAD